MPAPAAQWLGSRFLYKARSKERDMMLSESAKVMRLRQDLARRVHERTGQRVRDLTIEVGTNGIVLRGRSPSYYVKQLAQQGVWELLPNVGLRNAIVVGN
jgi:hypothetical protein